MRNCKDRMDLTNVLLPVARRLAEWEGGDMVKVFQVRMKIYFLECVPAEKIQAEMAAFLDKGLVQDAEYAKLHEERIFKLYCFDSCYPVERDKVYKKGKIYTLTVRTVDGNLAKYFAEHAVNGYTGTMKGITAEVKVIPQKHMDVLYTLTPVILKCEKGYWRDTLSVAQYEERLKVNLLKKWNQFSGKKMAEDFGMFTGIEFLNRCPVGVEYKGIRLLGDKLRLYIAENASAQRLAQMAVGTGLGEINARGYGYCNYHWI